MNTMEIDITRTRKGWEYREHQTNSLLGKIKTVHSSSNSFYWKTYGDYKGSSCDIANDELQEFIRQRAKRFGITRVNFRQNGRIISKEFSDIMDIDPMELTEPIPMETTDTTPVIFQYEGKSVTFLNSDGTVMVNATEMAKPFGKNVGDWLRQKSTNEFVETLSSEMGIPISQLVVVNKGNSSTFVQGTWMHEDVALEFARWLSPKFAIWCNRHIKELMMKGVTAIRSNNEIMTNNIKVLEKRLEEAQSIIASNHIVIDRLNEKIELMGSDYDQNLNRFDHLTTTQIARELGMETTQLNFRLKGAGIICKESGRWVLCEPYRHWWLADSRTKTITDPDGEETTITYTVWTQKGRRFIHTLHRCGYNVENLPYPTMMYSN